MAVEIKKVARATDTVRDASQRRQFRTVSYVRRMVIVHYVSESYLVYYNYMHITTAAVKSQLPSGICGNATFRLKHKAPHKYATAVRSRIGFRLFIQKKKTYFLINILLFQVRLLIRFIFFVVDAQLFADEILTCFKITEAFRISRMWNNGARVTKGN